MRSSAAAVDSEGREGAQPWTKQSPARIQWRQAFTQARAAPEPAVAPAGHHALPANICMVGAGNMGGAMVRGWIESGSIDPARASTCARSAAKVREWQDEGVAEVRCPMSSHYTGCV